MNIKLFTSPEFGVAGSVHNNIWQQSYSSHPAVQVYVYYTLVYKHVRMEIPDHCPTLLLLVLPLPSTPRGLSPSHPPGGVRAGVRACINFPETLSPVYMTHWEIGNCELIIKTKTHYTYLIPRRRVLLRRNQQFLDCMRTGAIIHTPAKRSHEVWIYCAPALARLPLGEYARIVTETIEPRFVYGTLGAYSQEYSGVLSYKIL